MRGDDLSQEQPETEGAQRLQVRKVERSVAACVVEIPVTALQFQCRLSKVERGGTLLEPLAEPPADLERGWIGELVERYESVIARSPIRRQESEGLAPDDRGVLPRRDWRRLQGD